MNTKEIAENIMKLDSAMEMSKRWINVYMDFWQEQAKLKAQLERITATQYIAVERFAA